ncbi:MAG TPA: gluconate 2-dehydrogenase subunit 3 family protein [Mycobacteriales bacterium]|jgi:hypothetical protein|nr:gluconate 2-dehydrogenase subunit 3 family protein [Mycobacteriales bacterium]
MELMLGLPGGKPPLGGWLPPVRLTATQAAVLNAVSDRLIPGGDGFPAPSEVDVLGFVTRYVSPAGQEPKWYPFLGERDVGARLDGLGQAFLDSERQVEILRDLERDDADFFTRLRDVVYYAYYSRPAVIRVINEQLPAGRDYRNSPMPFGYSDVMDDWDDALLARVRGTYTRTEDVVRLPVPAGAGGPAHESPDADGASASGNPLPGGPLATVTP